MKCKKVLPRLQAYVDGEVPERLMSEMEEHLDSCPGCRSQVERIRAIGDVLDNLTVPPLPEGFSVRVMAEAKRRAPVVKGKKSFFPLKWQPLQWVLDLTVPMRLAACAVVLLACLLGVFMSEELSSSVSTQTSVAEAANLDGFEWFSSTPPASLGSAYLTMAGATPIDKRK